jgi:hypothetical protein
MLPFINNLGAVNLQGVQSNPLNGWTAPSVVSFGNNGNALAPYLASFGQTQPFGTNIPGNNAAGGQAVNAPPTVGPFTQPFTAPIGPASTGIIGQQLGAAASGAMPFITNFEQLFNTFGKTPPSWLTQLAQQYGAGSPMGGNNTPAASPPNYLMSAIGQWPFNNALSGLGASSNISGFGVSPNGATFNSPYLSPAFWQGQTSPTPSAYGGIGG